MLAPDLFLEGPLFIEQKVAYGCAGHGYDEGEGIAYAVILNESVQDAKLHQRSKCAKPAKRPYWGSFLFHSKFLSSNVQSLLRIKLEVIENIMPNIVACKYHICGMRVVRTNDAR